MENSTIAEVTFVLLVSALLFGVLFLIYKSIVSEIGRKQYEKEMKIGDKVYIPMDRTGIYGIITAINGDYVEVTTTFKKNRIYKK